MKLKGNYKIGVTPENTREVQDILKGMGHDHYEGAYTNNAYKTLRISNDGLYNGSVDRNITISAEDFIAKYGKEKTAEDWLKEIKCPEIRRRALLLDREKYSEIKEIKDIKSAIFNGHWGKSLEGPSYWSQISRDAPNIKTHDDYRHLLKDVSDKYLIEGGGELYTGYKKGMKYDLINMEYVPTSEGEKPKKPLAIPFKKCYTKIAQHNFLIQ